MRNFRRNVKMWLLATLAGLLVAVGLVGAFILPVALCHESLLAALVAAVVFMAIFGAGVLLVEEVKWTW